MRTAPERLLLRLEWRVIRRLDGRLQGSYRTSYRGAGIDFTGLRPYAEGDDARHIDWNVTARLGEPQLRVFTEDRELTVWLVLDRSASMAVGAPGRGKQDVLAELALALARLFGRGGNRVGALLYDTGLLRTVPPGTGRRHVLRIGAELDRSPPPGRTSTPRGTGTPGSSRKAGSSRRSPGQPTDLAAMLEATARLARRRGLIIVISDFIGEGDWERALLALARRHEVAVLRVLDISDDHLPLVGLVVVEDAETGEQLVIDSSDPLLRERFRAGVADRNERIAAGTRRAGVAMHPIATSDDLAEALVEVITRTRRRRA
jgi:uncharacterized protein (DUF58 family)